MAIPGLLRLVHRPSSIIHNSIATLLAHYTIMCPPSCLSFVFIQVGELRNNLAQMESMTMGKSQDLEEAMETYQTKVLNQHHIPDFLDKAQHRNNLSNTKGGF